MVTIPRSNYDPTRFTVLCCFSLAVASLVVLLYTQQFLAAYESLKVSRLCDDIRNLTVSPPAPYTILTMSHYQAVSVTPFLESKSIYAWMNGYQFRPFFTPLTAARNPVWSKVLALNQVMQQETTTEWIWLLDHDTLIFNFKQKLEDIVALRQERRRLAGKLTAELIISSDHNGLNAGSILVRNNAWTQDLVRRWWNNNSSDIHRIDEFYEQAALGNLIDQDPEISERVEILWGQDACLINCYAHTMFREGHLMAHFPGSTKQFMAIYSQEWRRMMTECAMNTKLSDTIMTYS